MNKFEKHAYLNQEENSAIQLEEAQPSWTPASAIALLMETHELLLMMLDVVFNLVFFLTLCPLSSCLILKTHICPKTADEMKNRSKEVFCQRESERYHCTLDSENQLLEMCIVPAVISANMLGCPYVTVIASLPYWMNPLSYCPTQNSDCPQEGHISYSTTDLYLFPACFLNVNGRINFNNKTTTERGSDKRNEIDKQTQRMMYWPYGIVPVILGLIILHLCILMCNVRHVVLPIGPKRTCERDMIKACCSSFIQVPNTDSEGIRSKLPTSLN